MAICEICGNQFEEEDDETECLDCTEKVVEFVPDDDLTFDILM